MKIQHDFLDHDEASFHLTRRRRLTDSSRSSFQAYLAATSALVNWLSSSVLKKGKVLEGT